MKSLIKTLLYSALWAAGCVAIVCGILYAFFMDAVVIEHNGMAPTIMAGDQILVWENATPEMGDIVVCTHPRDRTKTVVGRLFAKPGMSIEVERNNVTVAGERPITDRGPTLSFADSVTGRNARVQLSQVEFGSIDHAIFEPAGRPLRMRSRNVGSGYFLLSDNRQKRQHDSRSFGEVPIANCHGVAFTRLRPSETQTAPAGINHGALDILQ